MRGCWPVVTQTKRSWNVPQGHNLSCRLQGFTVRNLGFGVGGGSQPRPGGGRVDDGLHQFWASAACC